jgi:flagellar M-ring protein FliF
MNGPQRLWQQMTAIWQRMSTSRRTVLVTVAVFVLAGVVGVVVWSSQVEYRLLVSGLSAEDAGAITAKLQTQGVSFKLGAGGTAILVPSDQLAQVRVSLANDGMSARGGKGFEIFDESSLGMTPFVQNVNYGRALQAELARSIMQMDSIASARVHIVRPEQSPFVRDQKTTTAGVVLKLKVGATLNRSTSQAIAALVAHSVEGLAVENVTLMDTAGRLLSDLRGAESDGVPSSQMEYRRELEQYLAGKAEELLGKTLGYGRIIVKVAADINFKRLKEKKETYSPEERVVVSERVNNSNSNGSSSSKGGVAGAGSNVTRSSGSSGGGSTAKEESTQTDYLVSKTVQEFEDKLGHIDRLTVAAMVDLSGTGVSASGISVDEVGDIIKQAVGFKQGRDEIKIANVKLPSLLPPEEPDEEALSMQRWQAYFLMARNVSVGLSALLAMILGFLFLRRLRPSRAAPAAPAPRGAAAGSGPAGGAADAALDELTAAARNDPDMLARLLIGMMG